MLAGDHVYLSPDLGIADVTALTGVLPGTGLRRRAA
jgi:hypothetical protein